MPSPLEIVRLHFPWDVPAELQGNPAYDLMRIHGDFMATGGNGMEPAVLARLRAFHTKLRDESLVLEFDPNIAAEDGIDGQAGFAFRSRTIDDDELLIRVNNFTIVTEEGELIWTFPPDAPGLG